MKAQLTINLPDGWELAEPELRPARKGEFYVNVNANGPRVEGAWTQDVPTMGHYAILRRSRSEYVNVRMLRTDAEWRANSKRHAGHPYDLMPDGLPDRLTTALVEALTAADKEV